MLLSYLRPQLLSALEAFFFTVYLVGAYFTELLSIFLIILNLQEKIC